ncbi:MAG: hypothetical protein CMJ78_21995 [Planctomycetaceae bacterium]|nr:hypothetical protein [Planctomycetaceae bacterium]
MLSFITQDGPPTTRREWLRIGSLASLTAMSSAVSAAKGKLSTAATNFPGFGKAKNVLIVFASGGQSQLETWDPKPKAPVEIRGAFGSVQSAVPGTLVGEHLPLTSKLTDKFTIVRSMSHLDLDHGSAFYLTMTGRYHDRISSNPDPRPTDYPAMGSVLKRTRPSTRFVHTSVNVNGPAQVPFLIGPGQFGGLLGQEYDSMVIGDVTSGPIIVPGLDPRAEVPQVRFDRRKALLSQLDDASHAMASNSKMLDMNGIYRQAFRMLETPRTRKAFDLSSEDDTLRDRYGRNRSGQACLLSRRLIEAGVPLVTLFWNHSNRGQDREPNDTDWYGWDTHNDIFEAMRDHLMPRFDQGFSALIEDMNQRGLLDETLVLLLTEFGRAPLVAREPRFAGTTAGRKHWAAVYSIVACGAGVSQGKVLGESNAEAGYPVSEKYAPWDVTATIFAALGIDPEAHYTDPTDRPFPISIGRPINGLFTG